MLPPPTTMAICTPSLYALDISSGYAADDLGIDAKALSAHQGFAESLSRLSFCSARRTFCDPFSKAFNSEDICSKAGQPDHNSISGCLLCYMACDFKRKLFSLLLSASGASPSPKMKRGKTHRLWSTPSSLPLAARYLPTDC
jgi:hypothetical protein